MNTSYHISRRSQAGLARKRQRRPSFLTTAKTVGCKCKLQEASCLLRRANFDVSSSEVTCSLAVFKERRLEGAP